MIVKIWGNHCNCNDRWAICYFCYNFLILESHNVLKFVISYNNCIRELYKHGLFSYLSINFKNLMISQKSISRCWRVFNECNYLALFELKSNLSTAVSVHCDCALEWSTMNEWSVENQLDLIERKRKNETYLSLTTTLIPLTGAFLNSLCTWSIE